jgi:hypothetical protein
VAGGPPRDDNHIHTSVVPSTRLEGARMNSCVYVAVLVGVCPVAASQKRRIISSSATNLCQ